MALQDSITLISSRDETNKRFGTGFVIRKNSSGIYVLTCAHVLEDVGGIEQAMVNDMPAMLAASGDEKGIDLAVLKVEGLWDKPPLLLEDSGETGQEITTSGFQKFAQDRMLRPLSGVLGKQLVLQSPRYQTRVDAWDLRVVDNYTLQPGYSGSPVLEKEGESVIGVVSHRQGQGETGLAININALDAIWQVVDSQRLYKLLLKLGYLQQVRLFSKLVKTHDVAALLIYGEQQYGQRWLLNRLVSQYLPDSFVGRIVKIDLARKVRRSDITSLWRELARRVGLTSHAAVEEVIERVFRWWKTQNVLLILNDVDALSEEGFQTLLQEFWLPLATQARQEENERDYKLLLFLVDYEGCVGEWETPFVEKLDASWEPKLPLRSPRLEEFSDNDLDNWIQAVFDELPSDLKEDDEDTIIQEILEGSDDGIPELVLQEICDRVDVDWYEEISTWLKL